MELMNAGKTLEDARRGGSSGCVETGAWGSEAYILTGYMNIPKIFDDTVFNGYDQVSGKAARSKNLAMLRFPRLTRSYGDAHLRSCARVLRKHQDIR